MRLELLRVERRADLLEEHRAPRLLDLVERRNLPAPDVDPRPAHHALQLVDFLSGNEGERLPFPARATRAADAMRVIFGVVRQIEIEDDLQVIDVETARRDIRRHEELELPLPEFLHHAIALRLRDIAVQPIRHVAARVQVLVEIVDHDLRAAKNDPVAEVVHVDQPRERLDLRAPIHLEIRLLHLRGVLRHRLDFDPRRVFRIATDQVLNRTRNRRREKQPSLATAIFLAHLFHQQMVHELIVLQILSLLLDGEPTDDSVEIAVQLLTVSGYALLEVSPAGVRAVLERLRALLHEGSLNKRVEYKMEKLLALRKTGFRDFPPVPEELDLVESDDQITFEISLDDEDIKKEDGLDVFRFDPNFEDTQQEWKKIRNEILGGGDDDSDDSETDSGSGDDNDDDDDDDDEGAERGGVMEETVPALAANTTLAVRDLSEADLIHLRRSIYLTIMSSATFEECTHKLAKINIPDGREDELINMLIECCSQERTFLRYYGLISARFCLIDDRWRDAFMESFTEQYNTIHRLETNKLRNVAKLFAHLLHADAIPWSVLHVIHLNEDETTSSSRIFVKILVQEMAEAIGIKKLKARFETDDAERTEWFKGMFPKDNMRSTRYAINFFTSIGLGPLTDGLREHLKNAPKLILAQAQQEALAKAKKEEDDSSVSSSSTSSSSDSSSLSSSSSPSSSSSDSRSYSSSSSSSYSRRRRSRRGRSPSTSSSGSSRSRSRSYSSSSTGSRSMSRSRSPERPRRGGGRSDKRTRGRSRSYSSSSESSGSDRRPRGRSPGRRKDSQKRGRSPVPDKIGGGKDAKSRNNRVSRSRSGSSSRSGSGR